MVLIAAAMCLGVCRAGMDAQSVAGAAGQGRPRPHAYAWTFGMLIAFVILMVIIFVGMGLRRLLPRSDEDVREQPGRRRFRSHRDLSNRYAVRCRPKSLMRVRATSRATPRS